MDAKEVAKSVGRAAVIATDCAILHGMPSRPEFDLLVREIAKAAMVAELHRVASLFDLEIEYFRMETCEHGRDVGRAAVVKGEHRATIALSTCGKHHFRRAWGSDWIWELADDGTWVHQTEVYPFANKPVAAAVGG